MPVIGMESPRGVNDPSLGKLAEVLAKADVVLLLGKPLDFTLKFGKAFAPDCRILRADKDVELPAAERVAAGMVRRGARRARLPAAGVEEAPGHARIRSSCAARCRSCSPRPTRCWSPTAASSASGRRPASRRRAASSTAPRARSARRCRSPRRRSSRFRMRRSSRCWATARSASTCRRSTPRCATAWRTWRWSATTPAGTPSTRSSCAPMAPARAHGLDLLPTRYGAVAAALGAHGEDVSSVKELRPALERGIGGEEAGAGQRDDRARRGAALLRAILLAFLVGAGTAHGQNCPPVNLEEQKAREQECRAAGGEWARFGVHAHLCGIYSCAARTKDAGKPCRNRLDCEHLCITNSAPRHRKPRWSANAPR